MSVSVYAYRFIFFIVIIGLLLVLVSVWTTRNTRKYSPMVKTQINEIVERAARQVVLSRETSNAFLAVVHANNACGQLEALKQLAPPEDLLRLARVRYVDLEREAKKQQHESAQKLFATSPHLVPSSSMASLAGWFPSTNRNGGNRNSQDIGKRQRSNANSSSRSDYSNSFKIA